MIPTWSSLHPLIVHFPIALLLVAPIFIALSLARRDWFHRFAIPAIILLLVGTVAAWGAKRSGKAAMMKADESPAASAIMDEHEALAKQVVTLFTGLTAAYLAITIVLTVRKQSLPVLVRVPAMALFLGVNAFGAYDLARAAHLGGVLVHKYGLHAELIGETESQNPGSPAAAEKLALHDTAQPQLTQKSASHN
jgi:uncharacterized membrane protein